MNKYIYGFTVLCTAVMFMIFFAAVAEAGCVSGSWVNTAGNGVPTTANVINSASCSAQVVTLCSYRVYTNGTGWLSTQTLFDSQTVTVQPGQTVTMTVDTDHCKNQVDAFVAGACPVFTSDQYTGSDIFLGKMTEYQDILCTKCTNECSDGEKICSGNGFKTCSKGSDGCYHWNLTNCASDEICQNGKCVVNCSNECNESGQRECSGNGYRTCGNYDSDRCLKWSAVSNCASTEVCINGSCIDKCYDNSCYNQPTVTLSTTGMGKCGQGFRLKWVSTDATACTASGAWDGPRAVSGSENIGSFKGSRTFMIKCWGKGGTATDSITVDGDEGDYSLDVDAGDDVTLDEGDTVRLRGSIDGDYDELKWECNGGDLEDENTLRPTFEAPSKHYDYDKVYTCTLTASNECDEDSDTVKVRVNAADNNDIEVNLTVEPASGCAALNDVDLTAEVETDSNNDEDYQYFFDCEDDGDWDKDVNTSKNSYTAKNLCDYRQPGTYTAKVKVVVFGRTATDTATIKVRDCAAKTAGRVNITKMVRSVGGGTAYVQTLNTNAGDIVSYRIEITAENGDVDSVVVSDEMPNGIYNRRNVRLNGANLEGNLEQGINIGRISQGETKTITYDATIASASELNYGQNQMTNTATATVDGSSAQSQATVFVQKSAIAGATVVSTGFNGGSPLAILAGLAGVIVVGFAALRGNIKAVVITLIAKLKGNSEVKLAERIDHVKNNNLVS